jgi:hypothetical protein
MPARVPMTVKHRAALLALPATEQELVRYHSLGPDDLAVIAGARTPDSLDLGRWQTVRLRHSRRVSCHWLLIPMK